MLYRKNPFFEYIDAKTSKKSTSIQDNGNIEPPTNRIEKFDPLRDLSININNVDRGMRKIIQICQDLPEGIYLLIYICRLFI